MSVWVKRTLPVAISLIVAVGLSSAGALAGKDTNRKGTKIVLKTVVRKHGGNTPGGPADIIIVTGRLKTPSDCLKRPWINLRGKALNGGASNANGSNRRGNFRLPGILTPTASTGDPLKVDVKKLRLSSGIVCLPASVRTAVPPPPAS